MKYREGRENLFCVICGKDLPNDKGYMGILSNGVTLPVCGFEHSNLLWIILGECK